jgi:MFS family permease
MSRFTGNRSGLLVLCTVQFVVILDVTIVATALPAIGASLGLDEAGLAWVVTAYTLVLGALLVPGGRVADLLGPRRALVTGLGVFVAASAACAAAWTPAVLIAARAVQGLGAALLVPAALALLTLVGAGRPSPASAGGAGRVVGWWTAAGAIGGGSGWVIGGLLTDHFGWPSVFWVNLPIGLAAILGALATLPGGGRRRDRRIDVRGAILVTAALGLLVFGLHELSWAPLGAAAALIALFVAHIRRDADPLLPPTLLRNRAAVGANLTAALLTASTTPAMFLSMLYLQQVRGLTPASAALLFPVFNIGVVAGSLIGARALRRVAMAGFVVIAAGVAVLLSGAVFAIGFGLFGAGLGAASVASTRTGTDAAVPEHRGVASGVLTASAQVGNAIGMAALTPLAGYRTGFLGAVLVALAGVAAALLLPVSAKPRRSARAETVGAGR